METPETIRTSLQSGEYVTSIDFKTHTSIYQFTVSPGSTCVVTSKAGPTSSKPYPLACPQHPWSSSGQRCQTDGFTEGYKNPPVSRRLVGESHIPPNLSPAHTDLGSYLLRTRLAGEQVRTGSKTGFQGGQGQTHTRSLADFTRQDTVNSVLSSVPSPAVHVPHRVPNSHRKASPPRSTSYETHTLALEEQLKGTGITGKGDTYSQITPPSPKVVAG